MERFKVHDRVRVKRENPSGTKRVPGYIRGKVGTVLVSHGIIQGYEHDHEDFRGPTYSLIFGYKDLFGGGSHDDKIVVDVNEYWLDEEEA
ncbi:MAG: SH3-like domain-containing protein [Nitrososphaerales archaeon]